MEDPAIAVLPITGDEVSDSEDQLLENEEDQEMGEDPEDQGEESAEGETNFARASQVHDVRGPSQSDKLIDAVLSNTASLVLSLLEEGSNPNCSRKYGTLKNKDSAKKLDFAFAAFDEDGTILVPAMHHAVRNCSIYHADTYSSAAKKEQRENAIETLKHLIEFGADMHTSCSFYVGCISGYVYMGIPEKNALDFAVYLKAQIKPAAFDSDEQHVCMNQAVQALLTAQRQSIGRQPMVQVPASAQALWKSLLLSEKFSDVVFVCGSERLPAHKSVLLTASEYFQCRFRFDDMQGKDTVDTETDPNILRAVLTFIYLGELDHNILSSKTEELLSLANEFLLSALKEHCENVLIRRLSVENVRQHLETAELLDCAQLLAGCFDFVRRNAGKVLVRPEMLRLASRKPQLWAKLSAHVAGGADSPSRKRSRAA